MRGRRDVGRLLVVTSVVLAVAAAGFTLFGPTGVEETVEEVLEGSGEPGGVTERRWTTTWGQIRAGEEDAVVAAVIAFPVAVALAALALDGTRLRRASRAVATGLLGAFAVVTGFSVGLFFVPAAAAMLAAAAAPASNPPKAQGAAPE